MCKWFPVHCSFNGFPYVCDVYAPTAAIAYETMHSRGYLVEFVGQPKE